MSCTCAVPKEVKIQQVSINIRSNCPIEMAICKRETFIPFLEGKITSHA